jgi:hypothetical protein
VHGSNRPYALRHFLAYVLFREMVTGLFREPRQRVQPTFAGQRLVLFPHVVADAGPRTSSDRDRSSDSSDAGARDRPPHSVPLCVFEQSPSVQLRTMMVPMGPTALRTVTPTRVRTRSRLRRLRPQRYAKVRPSPQSDLPTERPKCANCASLVPMALVGITLRAERTLTVWRCGQCLHERPVEI